MKAREQTRSRVKLSSSKYRGGPVGSRLLLTAMRHRRAEILWIVLLSCAGTNLASANAEDAIPPSSDQSREVDSPQEAAVVPRWLSNLFSRITYQPTGANGPTYEAFLHQPQTLQPGHDYPLVIWLHGAGDREFNGEFGPLLYIGDVGHQEFTEGASEPFFMLVPHCPPERGSWTHSEGDGEDMLSCLDRLLEQIQTKHPIDQDRISLIGISAGGQACWEWAARDPRRFCAVAPLSAGASDLRRLSTIGTTPVWAFANRGDGDIPERVEASVEILGHFGGNAAATIFESSGHNAWNQAFHDYDLFEWLTSKSLQDSTTRLPPGYHPGYWPWSYLAANGVPLAVGAAITMVLWLSWREFRNRAGSSYPLEVTETVGTRSDSYLSRVAASGEVASGTGELK